MKNIHVLPTDKPSRLHLGKSSLVLCDLVFNSTTINSQHIYITTDEKIKDGDWFITKTNDVLKVQKPEKGYEPTGKKIILTTDQDLIKDGVQAIDNEFLEWFVKNPSCEEVEIVEELNMNGKNGLDRARFIYKIIIPKEEPKFGDSIENTINNISVANSMFGKKEEPKQDYKKLSEKFTETLNNLPKDVLLKYTEPKQETLEEAVERMYKQSYDEFGEPTWDEGKLFHRKEGFIDGAKWQVEQFLKFIQDEDHHTEGELGNSCIDVQTLIHFVNQFKKK